ncbi:MAG: hypothetical protein EZS28_040139 [Streblomastix strix]|uniref:HIT-type domain-containing protein n=1 Tax=Streblomastix strix TaxID=222440 RepID=A0A5J4U1T1_9EUKA|nr:MAG: hypothetical protein EZS28_040139 [Streblomastix strix]
MSRVDIQYICHCGCKICPYRCPSCGAPYCSVNCYRTHSPSQGCAEAFFRRQVAEQLHSTKSSHDERITLEKTLQRIYEEYGDQSEFMNAFRCGELESMIPPYRGWWEEDEPKLIHEIDEKQDDDQVENKHIVLNDDSCGRFGEIFIKAPFNVHLYVHASDLLYCYCYINRLYNGDLNYSQRNYETASSSEITSHNEDDEQQLDMMKDAIQVVMRLSSVIGIKNVDSAQKLDKQKKDKKSISNQQLLQKQNVMQSAQTQKEQEIPYPQSVRIALLHCIESSLGYDKIIRNSDDEKLENDERRDFIERAPINSRQFALICCSDLRKLVCGNSLDNQTQNQQSNEKQVKNIAQALEDLQSLFRVFSNEEEILFSANEVNGKQIRELKENHVHVNQLKKVERKLFFFVSWAHHVLMNSKKIYKEEGPQQRSSAFDSKLQDNACLSSVNSTIIKMQTEIAAECDFFLSTLHLNDRK